MYKRIPKLRHNKNGDFYLEDFNIFAVVVMMKPSYEECRIGENGSRMKEYEAYEEANDDQGDLCVLEESDIPGASLNGKKPSELNVVQLKRWLSCRGAPLTGKKAELIER